jgi:hypothetical protein
MSPFAEASAGYRAAMPLMQTALTSMNTAFGPEAMDALDSDARARWSPSEDNTLSDALHGMPSLDLSDAVLSYINGWPSGLQAAIKGVIHENFNRSATVPITFAWKPGYDYAVEIYDVHDTETSRGGITIILTSRYPADPHPLNGSTAS